jgi:hypothetical protein
MSPGLTRQGSTDPSSLKPAQICLIERHLAVIPLWQLDCSWSSGRGGCNIGWGTTDVPRRWRGGNGNGQQLRVSLWSDVVQVRTARRRQGTAKGYELCGSGHESTGLGYVGKRRTSLEGFGKTDANRFSHDPRGKPMWMRSCAICKALLNKLQLCESVRCQCGWVW